jgi:chaperone required for assembly of F1-ATPase
MAEPSDPNPMKRAQSAMARQAPLRRFYARVDVTEGPDGFGVALDGRPARTPGRRPLAVPARAGAEAIAAEWLMQGETIEPARMHATRIANTAIDSFEGRIEEVQDDIAAYGASDLVFYRADEPEGLVEAQSRRWDPIVGWAEARVGNRLTLAEGVIHQAQTEAAQAAIRAAVGRWRQPVALAALHVMTTLTGSCLIALMAAEGDLGAEEAWQASIVDESWNASLWGWDEEAERRLAARRDEFMAAHSLARALA